MKVTSEAVIELAVTIEFDDGCTKTQVLGVGDYARVAYNKNGTRKVVSGSVVSINANPYSAQTTKRDWYFMVASDNPDEVGRVAKILVINVLDLEILHKKNQQMHVGTPNDPTRVTNLRVVNGYLQISQNDGHSWRTVGNEPLSDKPIPPDDVLAQKIEAMIGSDQYAGTDEFIQGIIDLIREESRKKHHRPWGEQPNNTLADMQGTVTDRVNYDLGGFALSDEIID